MAIMPPQLSHRLSNLPMSAPQRAHLARWLSTTKGQRFDRVRDFPAPFRGWLRNPDRLRRINADAEKAERLNRKTERWLSTLRR